MTTMGATGEFDGADRLVDFLSRSSSYPEQPRAVEVVETHISWVFLTDRYAYKLKKPVRFEFLDFSTRELRRQACLDEVRLNRRLAPDVYLDVLPITPDERNALKLGGPGRAVDWVVHMRRLPADKALDVVLTQGSLSKDQAETIARKLVDFYAGLPSLAVDADVYRHTLSGNIRDNEDMLTADQPRFRPVIGQQRRYLAVQAEQFAARVAAGRIVDGHGDLRPEHIFAVDPPAIIDCIEFSDELRRVDIADELAFLAMECGRLGDGGFGQLVLARYQESSGDRIPERVLNFYQSYRACVRAKVTLLRQQQISKENPSSDPITDKYFDLADKFAKALGPPAVVIVGGLSGTGKSTLAEALAEAIGAELLSTDQLRQSMYGRSSGTVDYGAGFYRPADRDRVYREMVDRADEMLQGGRSVVLDGTFSARRRRSLAYELATIHSAASLFVLCTCPRETALARIDKRNQLGNSASEARGDVYEMQLKEFEPPSGDETFVTIDSTRPMPLQLQAVYDALRPLLFK